jgi:type III secretory pathway component EscT
VFEIKLEILYFLFLFFWLLQSPISGGLCRRFGIIKKHMSFTVGLFWPMFLAMFIFDCFFDFIERMVGGD